MARNIFFSFSYEDVKNFKVNIVRNSWLLKNRQETFVDGSLWEKAKLKSDSEIKNLIDGSLHNTSTTIILIGSDTANRRWINYEIIKSFEKGNKIIGVHINRIKGTCGLTARGQNPLDRLGFQISPDGKELNFYQIKNRKWQVISDLPRISNKKSNSLYFKDGWFSNDFGEFFKFSDKFKTYCWDYDDGRTNLHKWIEDAQL